jgi:hypothetical protein
MWRSGAVEGKLMRLRKINFWKNPQTARRERPFTEEEPERVLFSSLSGRGRVSEVMKTIGQLLIGFTLIIVVASVVIVVGKVYLGEGPLGEERLVVPAATGSQLATPRP